VDRSRIAEFVLSCVLPAERAAAVTGDFLEEAEARGQLWFWSSVLRTVASRIVNDFRRRPFAMMGVGIAGCLRNLAFVIAVTAASLIFVLLNHWLPVMVNVAPPGSPPLIEPRWHPNWTVDVLLAVWLFQCGRWAARKMPGFEVAAGVSIAAVGWMAILAGWIYLHFYVPGGHIDLSVWHDLPLIAGAVVQRRWRMA
jgi:hypothetical protein